MVTLAEDIKVENLETAVLIRARQVSILLSKEEAKMLALKVLAISDEHYLERLMYERAAEKHIKPVFD